MNNEAKRGQATQENSVQLVDLGLNIANDQIITIANIRACLRERVNLNPQEEYLQFIARHAEKLANLKPEESVVVENVYNARLKVAYERSKVDYNIFSVFTKKTLPQQAV